MSEDFEHPEGRSILKRRKSKLGWALADIVVILLILAAVGGSGYCLGHSQNPSAKSTEPPVPNAAPAPAANAPQPAAAKDEDGDEQEPTGIHRPVQSIEQIKAAGGDGSYFERTVRQLEYGTHHKDHDEFATWEGLQGAYAREGLKRTLQTGQVVKVASPPSADSPIEIGRIVSDPATLQKIAAAVAMYIKETSKPVSEAAKPATPQPEVKEATAPPAEE